MFKKQLVEQFLENEGKIKVSGLLHSKTMLHLAMTSLNSNCLTLDMPVEMVKVRFKPLYLDGDKWKQAPYQLDSHEGKPLHTHFINNEQQEMPRGMVLEDVFRMILGTEFNKSDFEKHIL